MWLWRDGQRRGEKSVVELGTKCGRRASFGRERRGKRNGLRESVSGGDLSGSTVLREMRKKSNKTLSLKAMCTAMQGSQIRLGEDRKHVTVDPM
jgi:hypothetical protein